MSFHRAFHCCSVWELKTLVEILSKHGLHVVTDADKRVLDAMANAVIGYTSEERPIFARLSDQYAACAAELARRGEKTNG